MRCLILMLAAVTVAAFAAGCDYTKKHHESMAIVHSPGISGHNVTIPYTLLGTELTGINVRYSLDGHFWFPATRGWGGEGEMGLETSVVGEYHTWSWDSLADIGPALSLNVMVKILPWGRGKGNVEGISPVFIVNNTVNTRPSAIISDVQGNSGNIIVEYGVADAEVDALTATLQFSVDGVSFFDTRLAENAGGEQAVRLESSIPPGYTTHYLVWDSLLDIGPNYQPDVRLRIEIVDGEAVNAEAEGTTPSYTPDVSPEYPTWVDNRVAMFIDGSSQIPAFWSGSRDAVTADFDGDGDTDIFVCNEGENFFYSNDGGQFSQYGQILHDDTREVVAADFDGDGLPDVFAANKGWNMIYHSDGTQSRFSPLVVGYCEETRGAACRDPAGNTVDFDHDGNPDVFVCNLPVNTVYLNPGTAGFSILWVGIPKDDCRGAAIADFDGDGELDVFCCCRFLDRLLLGEGDGNFTVAAEAMPGGLSTSWRAAAFDFEGDGDYDVFVGKWGQNIILINQGGAQGGTQGKFRGIDILPRHVNNTRSVAAFSRGGVTYLVTGNTDDFSRLYRIYKGRVFDVTPVNFPAPRAFTYGVHVAVAPNDIDGDGITDIYVANKGQNVLLLGQ